MPFCPKCMAEYRDGFTVCADCGVDLLDMPDNNEHARSINKAGQKLRSTGTHSDEVLLANTNDVVALSYLISMLKAAEIPFRVIAQDISQYLQIIHGKSYLGSCLYVKSSDYSEAQEILKSFKADYIREKELIYREDSFNNPLIAPRIFIGIYLIFALVFLGGV